MLYLRRVTPQLLFARSDCRMDAPLLRRTARYNFVTGLHQSSLYIGKLLVQGAVNTGVTDMISAYTATTASRALPIRSATAARRRHRCSWRRISVPASRSACRKHSAAVSY